MSRVKDSRRDSGAQRASTAESTDLDHGRGVSRTTYDRSHRYDALRTRRPAVRFGVRAHRVDAYIEAFLTEREARGLSPETLRSYVADLGVFAQWLRADGHPENPADWDVHLLRGYVAYLQRKPSKMRSGRISSMTVRSYTSRLLAFLRWLYEEDYASTDLATKLRKPQATHRVIQSLTSSEAMSLLKAARSEKRNGVRNLALLHVMLDSGLRASEICAMQPLDVLWEQRLLKVLGKGGKERVVPFSHETGTVLRRYLMSGERREERAITLFQTEEGWALTPHGLHHIVKKVAADAGVQDVHPHRLRHTFALTYLRNGGNALALQRLLGHSTLAMTNQYVAMVTDDLQRDHDRCSPIAGLLEHASVPSALRDNRDLKEI